MCGKQMVEELEAEESMFVQTAQGITSDGTTLTLREVTPSTLYFSDPPQADRWAHGNHRLRWRRRQQFRGRPAERGTRVP
jgi:hypothetical protein